MRKQNDNLHFSSDDNRFQLLIDTNNLSRILEICKKSDKLETGGVLLGYYTENCKQAIITRIIDAPKDSFRSKYLFVRGIKDLISILDRMWLKNNYYLGEWHYHPLSASKPSSDDIDQMTGFANTEKLHCPEPILLIIGGNPEKKWNASAFVFPRYRKYITLKQK